MCCLQTVSFVSLVILLGEFTIHFVWRGFEQVLFITSGSHTLYLYVCYGNALTQVGHDFHPLPAIGNSQLQLVSVFIFSWAYTMFIPSWVNEKKTHVSVNHCVWLSGLVAFVGYIFVATLYGHFEHIANCFALRHFSSHTCTLFYCTLHSDVPSQHSHLRLTICCLD